MVSLFLTVMGLGVVAAVTVALGLGVTALRSQQRLQSKALEVRELEARAQLPTKDPELPAFVDADDAASMAAWNKARSELDI